MSGVWKRVHFEVSSFENVVYRDPIHASGLHCDGPNPALLQPDRHLLQLGRGATEALYWLAITLWRRGYIVGFVADINAGGIRMDHLQADVFALDLSRHLSPLLAVHLL